MLTQDWINEKEMNKIRRSLRKRKKRKKRYKEKFAQGWRRRVANRIREWRNKSKKG